MSKDPGDDYTELEDRLFSIIAGDSDEPVTPEQDDELCFLVKIAHDAVRLAPVLEQYRPAKQARYHQSVVDSARTMKRTPGIGGRKLAEMLDTLEQYHKVQADEYGELTGGDKGKQVQRFIMSALIDGYAQGAISIKPSKNAESKFSELFKTLCIGAGVKPGSVANHINAVQNEG